MHKLQGVRRTVYCPAHLVSSRHTANSLQQCGLHSFIQTFSDSGRTRAWYNCSSSSPGVL